MLTYQEIDQELERIGDGLARCQRELSRLREWHRTGTRPFQQTSHGPIVFLPVGDGTAQQFDPPDFVALDQGE